MQRYLLFYIISYEIWRIELQYSMYMKISFNNADKTVSLKNRLSLKLFIEKRVKKEGRSIESLQYVFCSDRYLLGMNNRYLKKDYYTDIISFDLSEGKSNLIGEVYISVDRVKDNAKSHQTSYLEELHRVIFHGALHFCGYKDKKPSEAKEMRAQENKWLKSYLNSIC